MTEQTHEYDYPISSDMCAAPETVVQGEWIVDATTGVILGHVVLGFSDVTSHEDVESILNQLQDIDINKVALKMKVNAILKGLEEAVKVQDRRRAWIMMRYEEPLRRYADWKLKGKDARTYKTLYGKLSFNWVNGTWVLREGKTEEDAINWAKRFCKEAVKVKVSFLKSIAEKSPKFKTSRLAKEIFVKEDGRDKFTIDTGIEVPK